MVMIRIVEPERPESYRTLPKYDRADYWHCMYRAVRVKSADLVEIRSFAGQRMRVVAFLLMFLTLFMNIGGVIMSYGSWAAFMEAMRDEFQYVFFFEDRLREQYQTTFETLREKYTEQEFVDSYLNNPSAHSYRFFNALFFLFILWSMPLICLGIALFWPQACPVRFDRKHEVIYTWRKNHLYVADIGPFLGGLRSRITSEVDGNPLYHFDKSTGPVGIEMTRADGVGEAELFRVGPYPVCHAHQNTDVEMFISAFMAANLYDTDGNRMPWDGDWLSKVERGRFFAFDPLRWLGSKTLGRKHRFDEAKTEAALTDFMTHPDTRPRGQPHWRRGVPK